MAILAIHDVVLVAALSSRVSVVKVFDLLCALRVLCGSVLLLYFVLAKGQMLESKRSFLLTASSGSKRLIKYVAGKRRI